MNIFLFVTFVLMCIDKVIYTVDSSYKSDGKLGVALVGGAFCSIILLWAIRIVYYAIF